MENKQKKWIIIDTKTHTVLHGINNVSLRFSSDLIAQEVAEQLFKNKEDYFIACLNNGDFL